MTPALTEEGVARLDAAIKAHACAASHPHAEAELRAAVLALVEAEREACAKVCDGRVALFKTMASRPYRIFQVDGAESCASAIRARRTK